MAALVRRQGVVVRPLSREYFARLVRAIVGQQISVTAAASSYRRFTELAGDPPKPAASVSLSDEEIVQQLIAVRGIGRWTAEMFLMVSLGRPDVLAADDLGVQAGIQRLDSLEKRPTPTQVRQRALEGGWHPYATAACLQLWESLKNNPAL